MLRISEYRNGVDARLSSRFAAVPFPHGLLRHIAIVRCGLGTRFTMCVPRRRQLQAGDSQLCFLRYQKARIISSSPSEARARRSSDTDADSGHSFSSWRRSSLLGRCRRTPAQPQGPFTGTAVPSRQKRFSGCRLFRASGSSMGHTVSKFGKLVMPLLLSWRRFLVDQSQRSSTERRFMAIPFLQSLAPNSCLRPHLLGR